MMIFPVRLPAGECHKWNVIMLFTVNRTGLKTKMVVPECPVHGNLWHVG